jgi:hypothetical protein
MPNGNAVVGSYLGQLGLSYGAIFYLTTPDPNNMEWLSGKKAKELGIDTADGDALFDELTKKTYAYVPKTQPPPPLPPEPGPQDPGPAPQPEVVGVTCSPKHIAWEPNPVIQVDVLFSQNEFDVAHHMSNGATYYRSKQYHNIKRAMRDPTTMQWTGYLNNDPNVMMIGELRKINDKGAFGYREWIVPQYATWNWRMVSDDLCRPFAEPAK